MPSTYQPRRPRASPLWQLIHHGWDDFLAHYETKFRKSLGPLHPAATATVESFLRCGDLAAGFTRLQCPDCGHERLLAFTCKGRHLCPSCHQRRVRSISDWIATAVCHEVPHRQFVFTIPRVLRGIFRKRRHLLHLLFKTATEKRRGSGGVLDGGEAVARRVSPPGGADESNPPRRLPHPPQPPRRQTRSHRRRPHLRRLFDLPPPPPHPRRRRPLHP